MHVCVCVRESERERERETYQVERSTDFQAVHPRPGVAEVSVDSDQVQSSLQLRVAASCSKLLAELPLLTGEHPYMNIHVHTCAKHISVCKLDDPYPCSMEEIGVFVTRQPCTDIKISARMCLYFRHDSE